MQFSLSNDQRMTSLTANLPIRQIKRIGDLQEQLKENKSINLQSIEVTEVDRETETEAKAK
ncbi:MAG: hypothetical protein AAFQ14_04960, partial [Cyanobacteria bacterium J06621_12]